MAHLPRYLCWCPRPSSPGHLSPACPALPSPAPPPQVSREVVGRLMADPAFMQKLVLEQMITISSSLIYEAKVRGDRFWNELDLVAANVVCLSAGGWAGRAQNRRYALAR